MPRSACFVTPSYAPDFERCRLLSDSLAACAPDLPHYIIVDPGDLRLFGALASARTTIVDARDVMDRAFFKAPGAKGWWLSLSSPPVRGWIAQQLFKLAMPRIVTDDVLLYVDSDVVFTRPFSLPMVLREDRLALFEIDYRSEELIAWARTATELFGGAMPDPVHGYVGNLISWWREQALALTEAIERAQGRPWQSAIARGAQLSEYMTYGTYVRSVPGLDGARHFSDSRMLVQTSWEKPLETERDLELLFRSAPEGAVAVMVHSKSHIDAAAYRRLVERMWLETT